MPSIRLEDLTPFGRLSLTLDREFSELADVGQRLSRLDVESDSGLDEGVKLLNRAAKQGQSLAATMQEFSGSLQEARAQAEAAATLIAERGALIRERRRREEALQAKLAALQEEVKAAGAGLAASQKTGQGELSEEDKRRIAADLERMDGLMARFVESAQAVKAEAAGAHFRRLERQVGAMIDSLQASRQKIARAISPK